MLTNLEWQVTIDKWPVNIYKTMPLPGFDKTNWNHEKVCTRIYYCHL